MKNTDIKLPFGLNEHKTLVHVSEVPKGKKCGCICPACQTPLLAIKGTKNQHHFRHDVVKQCVGGVETAIHMYAKQIIKERNNIALPEYALSVSKKDTKGKIHSDQEIITKNGTVVQFDLIEVEKGLHGIIADILAVAGGKQLIIEIFYRHKVDEHKREKIIKSNMSAIEIDLSRLSLKDLEDKEAFWLYLNDSTNIKWLHHNEATDRNLVLEARLEGKIQQSDKDYLKEKIEKITREDIAVNQFLQAMDETSSLANNVNIKQLSHELLANHEFRNLPFSLQELPVFLDVDVPNGDWIYGCDRRSWQISFYNSYMYKGGYLFTIEGVNKFLEDAGFKVSSAVKILEEFVKSYPNLVPAHLSDEIPTTNKALKCYFNYLCDLGMLEFAGTSLNNDRYVVRQKTPAV